MLFCSYFAECSELFSESGPELLETSFRLGGSKISCILEILFLAKLQ